MYDVELNYNDVRMFSIESFKKTKFPTGLYWPSQSYYHIPEGRNMFTIKDEEELYQNLKNLS